MSGESAVIQPPVYEKTTRWIFCEWAERLLTNATSGADYVGFTENNLEVSLKRLRDHLTDPHNPLNRALDDFALDQFVAEYRNETLLMPAASCRELASAILKYASH